MCTNIKQLYEQFQFQFIGIEDIELDSLHISSPYFVKDSINLSDYEISTDRIRMLDNDLIRLRSKLNTILTMRENQKNKK